MADTTLREAIEEFLLGLQAANRAEKTLRWYGDILRRFEASGGELTEAGIVRYLASRRDHVAAATLSGEHRALKRLCRWLVARKLMAADPMALVEPPSRTETVPRIATAQTAIALALAAERGNWPARDRALVLVLSDTGARLAELLAMRIDNLRIMHTDAGDYGEALVTGKGRRTRRLLIGAVAMTELARWIAERPNTAGNHIWWGEQGPLTRWGVRELLDRLSERAGLPEHINPHAFRHGLAVDMILNGADLRTVQLVLGHTQIGTTVGYLKLADQVIAASHHRISDVRWQDLPASRVTRT